MAKRKQKIIVVGAGIIGAAAAFELSQAGAEVVVIDAGVRGATDASFGWINASFYQTPEYFALRVAGIDAYRALEARLAVPIRWNGSLAWEFSGDALDAQFKTLRDAGYPCRMVTASQIARMEPELGRLPDRAIHFSGEAAAEPQALTQALLTASGAQVLRGLAATGLIQTKGRVTGVRTQAGDFAADHVLIAAGTGCEALLKSQSITVPMLHRPALVLKTAPVPVRLSHILATDFGEVRQLPGGALTTPAAINHQGDASQALAHPQQAAALSMSRLKALFPKLELSLAEMHLAERPVPKDGFPAVGFAAPGLYVATLHSGITLAALIGRLVAQEIAGGTLAPELDTFRPDRFA